MGKGTLTCPACGRETAYAPGRWVDFANWVRGGPTHIGCQHCGVLIPLPYVGPPATRTAVVMLAILGFLLAAVLVVLGYLIFKLI